MKIEILNKSNKKRIVIGVLLCTLILLVLVISTRIKYKLTESINTGNKISSNALAIKIENEETGEYDNSDVVPTSGYTLNTDSSYCEVNGVKDETVTLEYRDGKVYAKITNSVTNCYVYFDKIAGITASEIIAKKTISTRTDFSTTLTTDTTGTVYTTEDLDGTTYYYAGAPTDNWVKFAGYYWRIIRINGNGSIRIIYQGTAANETGSGTVLSTYYEDLSEWYNSYLASYDSYLDTASGFCKSSENVYSTSSSGSYDYKYYETYGRLVENHSPSLKCSSRTNTAYGVLYEDEIVLAGGAYNVNNTSYYLYVALGYSLDFTKSRYEGYQGWYNYEYDYYYFFMGANGQLTDTTSYYKNRPVINLNSTTLFTGTGTSTDPYTVVGAP